MLNILTQIKDWQINHGFLLKLMGSEEEHSVLSYPVGVSVFPTPFPRTHFNHAMDLQETYNELYCTIAEDENWLYSVTKDLIPLEPLVRALWGIYEETKKAGIVQDISAGIFRSDYMLHQDDEFQSQSSDFIETSLKQVEFNAFSCAGGSHANRIADMHRYLTRTGVYELGQEQVGKKSVELTSLPHNTNIQGIASCLASAYAVYGSPKSQSAQQSAVLFLVQPNNFNIADERPIEYALWDRDEPIPAYRLHWEDILRDTSLTDSRQLLFHPPWMNSRPPVEISVVYLRAGYEAHEYDALGFQARLRIEKSAAIKCPSILSHISTFKKVQQALTEPGALERFLSAEKSNAITKTFVPVHPLDDTVAGLRARKLATDCKGSARFILKPSLEGGGHNVYGDDIPNFLSSIPQSEWSSYILMERIMPPTLQNILMGPAGVGEGEVVSELGTFGACLWRRKPNSENKCEILDNSTAGWTFKTKYAEIDEMSVVKGYGCFDTPQLL
jgi:glutathione synthase